MDMRNFLEALDTTEGNFLFEGKEGAQVPAEIKKGLENFGIKESEYKWIYKPDDYDLVVLEHKDGGDKGGKWSVVFLTEAEVSGDDDEEDIFGESLKLLGEESDVGMRVIDQAEGNFLDTVNLCIEIASGKGYKGGFTQNKIKQAMKTAEKKS